jgi:hypothetical protein
MFFHFLTPCNISAFFTRSGQLLSILLQHHVVQVPAQYKDSHIYAYIYIYIYNVDFCQFPVSYCTPNGNVNRHEIFSALSPMCKLVMAVKVIFSFSVEVSDGMRIRIAWGTKNTHVVSHRQGAKRMGVLRKELNVIRSEVLLGETIMSTVYPLKGDVVYFGINLLTFRTIILSLFSRKNNWPKETQWFPQKRW